MCCIWSHRARCKLRISGSSSLLLVSCVVFFGFSAHGAKASAHNRVTTPKTQNNIWSKWVQLNCVGAALMTFVLGVLGVPKYHTGFCRQNRGPVWLHQTELSFGLGKTYWVSHWQPDSSMLSMASSSCLVLICPICVKQIKDRSSGLTDGRPEFSETSSKVE